MALYYSSKVFSSVNPEFITKLSEWYRSRGEMLKIPIFNHQEFDLAKLWHAVREHGGSEKVCQLKRWAAIGRLFNPPASMTNLSFHMKRLWFKYLLDYERELYQAGAMQVDESEYASCRPKVRSKRSDEQLLDSLSMVQKKRLKPNGSGEVGTPGSADGSHTGDFLLNVTQHAGRPRGLTSCRVRFGEQTMGRPAPPTRVTQQPQTVYLATSPYQQQPQQQQQQRQQQQEGMQQCSSILLMVPAPTAEKLAFNEQAVALAAAYAEEPTAVRSEPQHAQVVPVEESFAKNESRPVQQTSPSREHSTDVSQLQHRTEEQTDANSTPMLVEAPEEVQVVCLEDYYRQRIAALESDRDERIAALQSSRDEEIASLKQVVEGLRERVQELECNLASTSNMAEETQLFFDALMQMVQPNAGNSAPLVKKLMTVHRQPAAECADQARAPERGDR